MTDSDPIQPLFIRVRQSKIKWLKKYAIDNDTSIRKIINDMVDRMMADATPPAKAKPAKRAEGAAVKDYIMEGLVAARRIMTEATGDLEELAKSLYQSDPPAGMHRWIAACELVLFNIHSTIANLEKAEQTKGVGDER